MSKRYEVLRDGREVLEFTDEPGVLMSTAIRPPGFAPPAHPFVNAQALDASHEHKIASILKLSSSTADFINRLKKDGFDVVG